MKSDKIRQKSAVNRSAKLEIGKVYWASSFYMDDGCNRTLIDNRPVCFKVVMETPKRSRYGWQPIKTEMVAGKRHNGVPGYITNFGDLFENKQDCFDFYNAQVEEAKQKWEERLKEMQTYKRELDTIFADPKGTAEGAGKITI